MIPQKLVQNLYLLVFVLLLLVSLRAYLANSLRVNDVKVGCLDKEREALLKFKDELIDEYGMLSSWGTSDDNKDCCKWNGVQCHNQTNHVILLDLHGRFDNFGSYIHIEGKISPWLRDLENLSYLDLSLNMFLGSRIPEFIGSLNRLRYLDLSYSFFTGEVPHHIGNLSQLQFLSLAGLPYNITPDNTPLASTHLEWLSQLHSLIHLDLSGMNLKEATNWLQAITKLPQLQVLHLESTHLPSIIVSPSLVMNDSKCLSVIDLSNNDLASSSVFPWLFNFSDTLTDISLDQNNLQGSIPDAIGNINFLQTLSLSQNKLEGGFPTSFWNISGLIYLDLSYNNLSGALTHRLGTFSKLETLRLSGNQLEGVITEADFLNLSQLQDLGLLSMPCISFNFSSKWIPHFQLTSLLLGGFKLGPYFPVWLRTQNKLRKLVISNASIDDTFPYWFWHLCRQLQHLDLSHNNIHGVIPDLSSTFTDFQFIDLSFNNFNCSLPNLPPSAQTLVLSNNRFWGSLNIYCNRTFWFFLDLSDNLLSGDLPDCLANLENLEYLNLAHNNFSGKIPSMRKVSSLHLQNNSLTGEIPRSLENCTYLRFIDLSENKFTGKIPMWMAGRLQILVLLNLRSNQLFGNIPSNLCQLPSLQVLDLSLNRISGPIPNCLSNFTAMVNSDVESLDSLFDLIFVSAGFERANLMWKGKDSEYGSILKLVKLIDLSSNNLDGEIPDAFTSLVSLVGLNLSRNNLTGLIPPQFAQLASLNFLDLSRNQLSGEIPTAFSHLDRLGVLDLSYNNLSGKIPWIHHLQTFNSSIFEENPGLCGPPLAKVCPGDEITEYPKFIAPQDEDKDKFITDGYYISMGLGFIFGFLGVIVILVLNQALRFAFFMLASNILDWMYVKIAIYRNRLRDIWKT